MSKIDGMASDANVWPEGTWRAEISQRCAPRLALLNGDTTAAESSQRQFNAVQYVATTIMEESKLTRSDVMREVERRLVGDVMLTCWDEGYWPITPLVVRWYCNTNVAVGFTPIMNWVEQSS